MSPALLQSPEAATIYGTWREAVLDVAPLDRAEASAAAAAVYEATLGRAPEHVIILASPRQALLALGRRGGVSGSPAAGAVHAAVAKEIGAHILGGLNLAVSRLARAVLFEPVRLALADFGSIGSRPEQALARAALADQLPTAGRPRLPIAAETALDLPRVMGWLAQRRYMAAVLPQAVDGAWSAFAAALEALCRTCGGWCWLTDTAAVVSERPEYISADLAQWPADVTGPVLGFRDGFVVHTLQGAALPTWIVEAPHLITTRHIEREPNAEVRRLMLERMGIGRYLAESGAVKVAEDDTGILWRREFPEPVRRSTPRRAPLAFVEVVNGSREPDGSYRRYFLRVPPWMRTPREAVAWTYGLSEDAYRPMLRT